MFDSLSRTPYYYVHCTLAQWRTRAVSLETREFILMFPDLLCTSTYRLNIISA